MSTLNNVASELNNIKIDTVKCYNRLLNILISKNIKVSEEDKLNDLINKINELEELGSNIFEIYTNGVEYVPIKNGNISGGSVIKSNSFISLYALNPGDFAEIVTDIIDYAKYSKLYIEWENQGSGDSFYTKCSILKGEMCIKYGSFKKEVGVIDISSIESSSSISISTQNTSDNYSEMSMLKIHRIWLEK